MLMLEAGESPGWVARQLGHTGVTGFPRNPRKIGAADRIRTGDVQLGKLAFCH
jgi:hypothetical protein